MATHHIQELTDPGTMPLEEWLRIIVTLIQLYGPKTELTLDAGYNNIAASVSYTEAIGVLNSPKE